jgi:hypothetical protein
MILNVLRDGDYVEINGYSGIIDFDNDNLVSMSCEDLYEVEFEIENWESELGSEHLFIYLKNNIECNFVVDLDCIEIKFKYEDLLKIV